MTNFSPVQIDNVYEWKCNEFDEEEVVELISQMFAAQIYGHSWTLSNQPKVICSPKEQ